VGRLPDSVVLYEVGPRDGLQNESARLTVDQKLRLIESLCDAGLTRIEIGSFVKPGWIPQLADTDEVARRAPRRPGVTYSALVPNRHGLDRALAAGLREVAVFMSASETHNQKNTNKSIAQSLAAFEDLVPIARAHGLAVRGYVSTVWGCPYEGHVPVEQSLRVASALRDLGVGEISLGDTIGVGNPRQTREIIELFLAGTGATAGFLASQLALHMHDTHGTALANCLAALELGIRTFDASVGGTGGCPYAPGAAGNLATEDIASMLQGMGIKTGVDLDKLLVTGQLAQELIGRKLPGRRLQAAIGAASKDRGDGSMAQAT
jgi:hydroxymethylglutaryl-CoA lyase